jgi:hypothetical protein
MEHNTEKNIRLKVQEAEQYPVRWNKDELWTRMEIHRTATRSKRPVYFSIAASLTVAVLAGVYIYQQTSYTQGKAIPSDGINSAQPAIVNSPLSESKDIPAKIETVTPGNAITQNSARIRIEEEPYSSAAALQATFRDTATVANQEMTTSVTIPESPQQQVVTDVDKRPKVIIGIIPPQEQPLVTQQEKNKKFRFLKGKSTNGESEGSQLIIARMN